MLFVGHFETIDLEDYFKNSDEIRKILNVLR
jgi:hypothetical protein